MAQSVSSAHTEKRATVPEWVYMFSDDQFVKWCRQHKLQVCAEMRSIPSDERVAIFRYALRQHLLN